MKVAEEDPEIFLQTRTISLQEVRKTLPLWIPPLRTEIDNFDNNKYSRMLERGGGRGPQVGQNPGAHDRVCGRCPYGGSQGNHRCRLNYSSREVVYFSA